MKIIRKLQNFTPNLHLKRVAAYARVSVDTDQTERSFSTQVSYFSNLIQSNPEWIYAGVYSDLGISGTSMEKRQGFRRMIADAEAGKIDIILTKSIQRFARNTVDLLHSVRHLKEIGVEVRFEKEHINSMSGDGELMLTILASFAQAESQNMSTNIRWAFKKKNEQGIPNQHFIVYGYRWVGDTLVPFPPEAKVVKSIYASFLRGKSLQEIVDSLKAAGVKSFHGNPAFQRKTISNILQNSIYAGEMLLQKSYTVSSLTKQRKKNEGELPKYLVADDHEAIIDKETFERVQALIAEKRRQGVWANKALHLTCFTGKLKDPFSKKSYHRHPRKNGVVYWESHGEVKGSIREEILKKISAEVLGLANFDENVFLKRVDRIEIPRPHTLLFFFKDGTTASRAWEDLPFTAPWTEERKQGLQERNQSRAKYPFSGKLQCTQCGSVLIHGLTRRTKKPYWFCRHCRGYSIPEEKLETAAAEFMKIPAFDGDVFRRQIEFIKVSPDGDLIFIPYIGG